MRTKRILLAGGLAIASSAGVVGAAHAAIPTVVSHTLATSRFQLVGDTTGVTRVSETDYSDGTALGVWSKDGVRYSAAGPNGSIVSFAEKPTVVNGVSAKELTITVSGPNQHTKSASRGYGRAVGAFAAANAASKVQARTVVPMTSQLPSICANVQAAGKGTSGAFCDYRQLISSDGSDWYVSDQMTGSAFHIFLFEGHISYSTGNQLVQWSPNAAFSDSSCTTRTWSVSAFGVGVSESSQDCPGAYTVELNNNTSSGPYYGQRFSNTAGTNSTGISAVDIDHSPANSNPYPSISSVADGYS